MHPISSFFKITPYFEHEIFDQHIQKYLPKAAGQPLNFFLKRVSTKGKPQTEPTLTRDQKGATKGRQPAQVGIPMCGADTDEKIVRSGHH